MESTPRVLLLAVVLETLALGACFVAWPRGDATTPAALLESASDHGPQRISGSQGAEPSLAGLPGLDPAAASSSAPRTEVRGEDRWNVEDPVGLIVFGRVLDADGKPVENGWVSATGDQPSRASTGYQKEKGYHVLGLSPGRWQLVFQAEGHARLAKDIELLDRPTRVRLDVAMTRALEVKVKLVTPDGRPLAQAMAEARERKELGSGPQIVVSATREPVPRPIAAADRSAFESQGLAVWRPNEFSERALPKDYAGRLTLRRPPPFHVHALAGLLVLGQERLDPGRDEVTVQVDLPLLLRSFAEVRCQVVDDESGKPIGGAKAIVGGWGGGSMGEQLADADGRIALSKRVPGPTTFTLFAADFEPFRRRIVLEPGGTLELGAIRLRKPVSLKGVVVEADGRPVVAQINVSNLDVLTSPRELDFAQVARSNAEGEFECKRLGRGRHLVTFSHGRGRQIARRIVDTGGGDVEGLRVVLEPWATLVVASKVGDEPGWCVVLRDAEQNPVFVQGVWGDGAEERHAPPGRHTAEVWHGSRLMRTVSVTLGGENVRIEVP